MSLVNNTMFTTLKNAMEQATGLTDLSVTNLQDIIDTGNDPAILQSKDDFVKSLVQRVYKNLYTDAEYTKSTNDIFFEDSASYGAIIQSISVDVPEVQANPAWDTVTSGTTTIGANTAYLPVVNTQYYGKTDTWSIPITYSDVQLRGAFESESGMVQFYAYVTMVVHNAIKKHREVMSSLNRNNYIAEKVAFSKSSEATGIHVINLVESYAKDNGLQSMSVADFRKNKDCLLYSIQKFKLFKDYLMEMSTVFNTAQKQRFITPERFAMQVLADFEVGLEVSAMSQTYHDEFLALPLHRTVASWQGIKDSIGTFGFNETSTIKVQTASDGTEEEISGVVALMVDKWAIMHTIVEEYVGFQHDDIKRLNLYSYQNTDRYLNDLTLNGLVFVLQDYTETPRSKSK